MLVSPLEGPGRERLSQPLDSKVPTHSSDSADGGLVPQQQHRPSPPPDPGKGAKLHSVSEHATLSRLTHGRVATLVSRRGE